MPVHHFCGIGLMSGSSLDGVDLAAVEFEVEHGKIFDWHLKAKGAIEFTPDWKEKLKNCTRLNAKEFCLLDHDLGVFFGESLLDFINKFSLNPDFIASHGHTVFHFPSLGFTKQIGNPAAILAATGVQTINDFRSIDMAFEGEGAPLAPVVERYLYQGNDFYLNLGGIANLSFHTKEKLIASDVCPANQLLNKLALDVGLAYDEDGIIARKGKVQKQLLVLLNQDRYLSKSAPKSMDNGYIQNLLSYLHLKHFNLHLVYFNCIKALEGKQRFVFTAKVGLFTFVPENTTGSEDSF